MKPADFVKSRLGFTLLELVISIGIMAIMGTAVILVLNPNETFRQGRDINRITDLNHLNSAMIYYQTAGGSSFGSANTIYVSLPSDQADCSDLDLPAIDIGWSYACEPSASYRNMDGTGWVPVDFTFTQDTIGALFSNLPVDPINTLSGGYYYTYIRGTWAMSAALESVKYLASSAVDDGGCSDGRFEVGNEIALNCNLVGSGVLSSAKAITAFSIASQLTNGAITGTDIFVPVSVGANLTALVPTISISPAASVSPLSGVAQNFTSPVTYTVTAEDSTTQNYTVTVEAVIGQMTNYAGTGASPNGIAFDGTNMWTANADGYSVTKITPAGSMTTYGTGPWPILPYMIAFDGTNMWTANNIGNSVTKITPAGATTTYNGTGATPLDIAFDGTNMWTANTDGNSVTKVTPAGSMTTYAGVPGPRAIAFDGINMWTANNDASVTKISPAGTMTNYPGLGVTEVYTYGQVASDIAFDGTNMWTVNFPESVSKISPSGTITDYYWAGNGMAGIAFDGTNMWTANNNDNSATRVSPDGTMTTYSGDLGYPYGIAFDGTNMWITSASYNRVAKMRVK